jgi:hypothetical protein
MHRKILEILRMSLSSLLGMGSSPLRLICGLQKDGWVFGEKRRGDRSGMEVENLRGVAQLNYTAII